MCRFIQYIVLYASFCAPYINPFAGYLISPETKDRGFLDKEEINLLVNAKMKNAQYELVRDLFVFSIFTGLSYSDVKNLTKNHLKTSFS